MGMERLILTPRTTKVLEDTELWLRFEEEEEQVREYWEGHVLFVLREVKTILICLLNIALKPEYPHTPPLSCPPPYMHR